jgi:phosphoglycerate dehydrogenase-like enzyme
MQPSRILVISDSFQTLPKAVALLDTSGHEITYVPELVRWMNLPEQHRQILKDAQAVIMGRVLQTDVSALALAPNLRVIALHTSGSDNVDIEAATRRGVLVTNVKGVNAEQCAEFAVGLMLSVVRQIRTGDYAIRQGLWNAHTQGSMDVYGATVGVIGLGQIARAFVKRVHSFGAQIVVHTRTPDLELAQQLTIHYASLDELLRQADVICLFASLNDSTRHMIGMRELGLMKRSAYLINIARGELIDEKALLEALRARQIAGAGLDVFETEPLLDSPLFALDNVVLTPHQAGLTHGAKTAAAVRAAQNALDVLSGVIPPDAINPGACYDHGA